VLTHSESVKASRRFILDLLLSEHKLDCFACEKNGDCALQQYAIEYDIDKTSFIGKVLDGEKDSSNRFYEFHPNRCILCTRCVRVCRHRQGCSAIGIMGRGFLSRIGSGTEKNRSDFCESCGSCVSVCPVGALLPKSKNRFRMWETSKTRTTCPYCGVGCQIDLIVKEDKVVGVKPAGKIANEWLLCVKGRFAFDFINHPARLTEPLIRDENGCLRPVSWEEALGLVAGKIKEIRENYGADAIAGFASAKATNEENYLFMKFMRAAVGTNNVDHCARLCHSSTVAGLAATLGSGAMTNPFVDVRNADVIFITGSNTTETHPVMGAYVRQAKNAGKKLIVADPIRIPLAEIADVFLQINPGTSVALSNGLLNVIFAERLEDKEYIEQHTVGNEALRQAVKEYTPEYTAEICGVSAQSIIRAARLYATAESAYIMYSMGITQHINGTENVMSLSNLVLATGNLGRPGCGINPLRGQNNVQGACDMGALPVCYTGYHQVSNTDIQRKFEKAWGVKLSANPGMTLTETMPAVLDDKVKLLYIMGENPAVSDADLNHTKKALAKAFLIVQDIFLTETAQLADVVLPAACFAEKDGTFVNSERRVQLVRKAVSAKGLGLADWEIIVKLMGLLGCESNYEKAEDIFNEITALTPSYAGMTYERLQESGGLCWPCPAKNHPGTPILHMGKPARGKGEFKALKWKPSPETLSYDYPIALVTNRLLHHYHTQTMTGKTEAIDIYPTDNFIQISPGDAKDLSITDGETVVVTSKRGSVKARAVVTAAVKKGVAAMPFHWAEGANILTDAATLDPVSKIPGLKLTGVRIAAEMGLN
jgi:formate dehydrogenase major subunit